MAFECGICTSMFNASARQPLILECGHTFCRECIQHNLGPQRWCPYCRQPINKHVDDLPRNYALENAMEAANVPLMELMDRWGLANAERMMVKPDQLQLVSLISRKGNTGEVWRGSLWGKAVAIKLLPLVGVDERQLDCLRREVAVLLHTTGECKQVCIYKGFCVKGGNFAIIMKLYSYSLAARVARHSGRRLPLPLALKYSVDLAKGLVELHRLGVTAADLKPDNVLIDDELGDAVIADFGISSVVTCSIAAGAVAGRGGRRGGGGGTRSSGVLRGTPNYMAPEQFTPGHRPTNKVDIWGFAATLLHMLTGSPPWAHDTLLQICTAVGVAKQAPPLPEGLPQQLEALLRACFEADPARRPTAGTILKALQAMGPVLERPQLMRATSSLARNSQLLAAARGVLVGLQQDCCQLVQQLQEGQAAGASSSSSRSGIARLHAVAEEEEEEQLQKLQEQQEQEQDEEGQGQGPRQGKKQHVEAVAGGKDDKQASLDQYLAQIGLLPLISQESSLGAPSAPPLPGSSSGGASSSSNITGSMASAAAGIFPGSGFGAVANSGGFGPGPYAFGGYGGSNSRGSSRPGSSHSNRSPNKLPRVLWSEEEAVQEEQEAQQQRRQQQQLQQQGLAASMGLTSPKRQPHHARSASELVVGSSRCLFGQELLQGDMQQQQQQRDCQLVGTAADAGSPKQHQRSVSEVFEVWGARPYGGNGSSSSVCRKQQAPGQLLTHFESPARSTASSSCAAGEAGECEQLRKGSGDGCQQQQAARCGTDDHQSGKSDQGDGRLTPGKQRRQWQIPAAHEQQQPQQQQQQQQKLLQRKSWVDDEQLQQRAQQQLAAMFTQSKWPSGGSRRSEECSAAGSLQHQAAPAGPLTSGAAVHRSHGGASSSSAASASPYLDQQGNSSNSSSPAAAAAGVAVSPTSSRKHQRTLSNLLLGRNTSGGSQQAELAAAATAGSGSSARGLSPRRTCELGSSSSSPDRLRRVSGPGGSASILAGAGTGLGPATAGLAGAGAAAAGAAGTTAHTSAVTAVAGGAAGAGAAAATAGAGAAGSSAGAAEAGKLVAPGVVASLASRFGGGGSSAASPCGSPKHAAAAQVPPSPTKASRWRALFGGSPARKRPQTPQAPKSPAAATPAAAHGTGSGDCSSTMEGAACSVSGSISPSPGTRGARASSSASSSAPDRCYQQQQQQQSRYAPYGAVPEAAGSPAPGCSLLAQQQQQQPGAGCSNTRSSQPVLHARPGTSSSSHESKSPSPGKSRQGQELPPPMVLLAPVKTSSSTHQKGGVNACASPSAAAAEPNGSCSPLKSHVRKLSLPAKLQGLSTALQEQQAAAAAAAAAAGASPSPKASPMQHSTVREHGSNADAAATSRSSSPGKQQTCSKSRLGQSDNTAAVAASAAAAAAAAAAANSSSSSNCNTTAAAATSGRTDSNAVPSSSSSASSSRSGGSHSQLLAEANQLEGLARQLSLSGRREEAEAALRSALAILSQHLGGSHPNSIAAMTRLALCLNKNGKANEAEGLLRQVLSHRQALLGRRHPQVAAAATNLAACLYGQGDYAAAAKMYASALEVRMAALGEQHQDTAACMHCLALCKSRLSQFAEAVPLYEQALSIRSAALGESHPDVATTAHQLGHCLSQQGRHSEALVYHKQGLWVRQKQPAAAGGGSSSEDQLASHRSVALCLAQLGCDGQAEEHLSCVLETRTAEVLALNPPPPPGQDVPVAAGGPAGRHSRQASFAAAGVFGSAAGDDDDGVDWSILADGDLRLTKQQQDALLGMAAAAEELGRCYSRQGKHGMAEDLYWQALEARSQVLGARHELVQATEEQLRECLDRQC